MAIVKDIRPITYLKAKAADLLNHINETHRPVIITQNGEARAVLQDPQTYEEMRDALALLKLLAIGDKEIKNGELVDQDKVFSNLDKKLKKYEE
ncbi:MAG: type II toxin-antitoxin system Phd/YefM family antitoxin [Candidatus Rifleibacteriota bacterium]